METNDPQNSIKENMLESNKNEEKIESLAPFQTTIEKENGDKITINIEVEQPFTIKPYIGGFKNSKNGIIFYHAFAQTDQIQHDHKPKNHRDTQTYYTSAKSTKLMREFGTQMERKGIFIDNRQDKTTDPKPYFSSEMWLERREEAARFIQRFTRGMIARKYTNKLKKIKEDKKKEELQKEEEFRKIEEVKHEKEIARRMHPRTKDDFIILYEELEL